MFSRFFIDRPIFAAVLSIFIVLAGPGRCACCRSRSTRRSRRRWSRSRAIYPGASAQVLEQTVAAPLENAINGVEDMLYMSSTSSAQRHGADPGDLRDRHRHRQGELNVNNRVKQASRAAARRCAARASRWRRAPRPSCRCSPSLARRAATTTIFISNYVTLNVLDELKRVPGTTNVQIFGAKDYAMRIWLRPDRLAQLQLTPADVAARSTSRTRSSPPARSARAPTGAQELVYTVTTQGACRSPSEFEDIILRANGDGSRPAPEGRGARRARRQGLQLHLGKYNGKPATLMGIFLQPGATHARRRQAVRDAHGRARSASRASPTRSRSTPRASSRSRSARW